MGWIEDRVAAYNTSLEASSPPPPEDPSLVCLYGDIASQLRAAAASIKATSPATQAFVVVVRKLVEGAVPAVKMLANNCLLGFVYVSPSEIEVTYYKQNSAINQLSGIKQTATLDSEQVGAILRTFLEAAFP